MLTCRPDKFSNVFASQQAHEMWAFLREPDKLLVMETASQLHRPALEALAPHLRRHRAPSMGARAARLPHAQRSVLLSPPKGGFQMQIHRAGSRPSRVGPAETFTGRVRIDPIIMPDPPARVRALLVTFEPGARTAWHTHPLGQTLIVTQGRGLVQREGAPPEEIRPGDVVWFEPGERHWHGAAPDTGMSHIAIQEADETGSNVTWAEHVTDAQYAGG